KSQLLQRVDTSVKGSVTRSYLLTHEPAPNGVTRLAMLQECVPTPGDPDPTCKPATRFGYHWEPFEFTNDSGFAVKPLLPGIVLDADGDGDHDLKSSGLRYKGGYHELLGKWEKFGLKIGADVVLTYYGHGEWAPLVNESIDLISSMFGEDEWKYIPPVLYRATGDRSN